MKAYDLISLENLSFGIFRTPELRYQGGSVRTPHMGQYLKKPIWNRVNNVRKQCFTVDLDPNYKNGIRQFAHLWVKCNRAITLKCHILFVHVVQFLESQKDRYPNKGLGFWAEQASEGSHNKADKAFAAYLR